MRFIIILSICALIVNAALRQWQRSNRRKYVKDRPSSDELLLFAQRFPYAKDSNEAASEVLDIISRHVGMPVDKLRVDDNIGDLTGFPRWFGVPHGFDFDDCVIDLYNWKRNRYPDANPASIENIVSFGDLISLVLG